ELTETYSMWEQRFNNFYSRNPNTEREKPRRRSNYRRAPKNKP
ncbi:MAG: hypothetical protein ACI8RA_003154, partial [Chlamydiales bacterium]